MFESNYNLEELNTFRIPSKAKYYFRFSETKELDKFVNTIFDRSLPCFILGGGSNVLFSENFDGLVIHPVKKDVKVITSSKFTTIVRAYSGLEWDKFVGICVANGWQGIENLTLIPGNVGASPVQNIGAYGTEASEYIDRVNCYDLEKKQSVSFSNTECCFTYRNSLFKQRAGLIVLSVDYKLFTNPYSALFLRGKGNALTAIIKQVFSSAVLSIKSVKFGPTTKWKLKMHFYHVRELLALSVIHPAIKRKLVRFIRTKTMPDPKRIGNVGCFFKSPIVDLNEYNRIKSKDPKIGSYYFDAGKVKVSAGDLIKSCQWNGKRIGDVSVEKNRPLIILNHGSATGAEILDFSQNIQADINKKFNINIEPEVVILGANQ